MVNYIYYLLVVILLAIIFVYAYQPEKNRIIIIPRGNMFTITTYSNGIVTDIKIVSSRVFRKWFQDYKDDKKLDEEGLEFDLESGKPIKKKKGRPKKVKDI